MQTNHFNIGSLMERGVRLIGKSQVSGEMFLVAAIFGAVLQMHLQDMHYLLPKAINGMY